MLAIPSPDVLLNLFASGAQVLGLLALSIGGGWMARKRLSLDGPGRSGPASRWPLAVAWLLVAGVSAAFLLYHLETVDIRNRRLQANLTRSSTEKGQKVGDTSLKTLAYSDQQQHPLGVTTDDLAAMLADGRPLNLIDVREPEEVEMGAIPGAWARRYPDLQADSSDLLRDGARTLLLCESGNRSSELCNHFAALGQDTGFLIGGYEKWVAEGRPMTGQRSDGEEIRATPDYPRKHLLLDTPEVVRLFTEQNALFVDVRYEDDFARGHLPGAVNVPLRKLRSGEMAAALAALPQRPIIAVCYDKRSSFYGLLLGLRLHRMGREFVGRYTVPHEFTVPRAEAEWVQRWRAERHGQTLLAGVQGSMVSGLGWLAQGCGPVLAILLLVLLLRASMLWFSLGAERDQHRQRALQPRIEELRRGHGDDPVLVRRAQLRMLKAAGIAPLRNLVGAVVQLVLFALAFAAVDAAATGSEQSFGWLVLGQPDPARLLPLLFAGVLWLFVRMQQQRRQRWLLPLLFTVGMTALVWNCRAAVQIYLIASIGLMAAQTALHRLAMRRRAAAAEPAPAPARLVDLGAAGRHPELGNKALRLGAMLRAGLPVPPGFVVPQGLLPTPAALAQACRRRGIDRAAVRSSAQGEDGASSSMAGMFRTELAVPVSGIAAALATVRASYGGRPGGVVVQQFQPAEFAGVMFTADPAHAGRTLVELVAGGGDALVSGRVTPQRFRFGRCTGAVVGDAAPPVDLQPLLALGRELERLFGGPQDVEWVFRSGRFLLVQSRDITRTAARRDDAAGMIEAERDRVLALLQGEPAEAPVLVQNEISELLPAPTAYSLDLFQALWAAGGSVDRACRALGMPYDVAPDGAPLVVGAFGRCFVDQRVRAASMARGLGAATSFRLAASAQAMEEQWQAAVPEIRRRALRLRAIDPAQLPDGELLQLCAETRQRFVTDTYARAEVINLLAEFLVRAARRQAARRDRDVAALLHDDTGNVVTEAFAQLAGEAPLAERVDGFLARFAHRAPHDFELAEPRYGEALDRVEVLARRARGGRAPAPATQVDGVLGLCVERARRCQRLKEAAKHEATRELAALRRLLLAVGDRFGLGQAVFELTAAEVAQLADPGCRAAAAALADRRRRQREALLALPVPTRLSAAAVEGLGAETPALDAFAGDLAGECVAGQREPVGRVRVLLDPERIGDLLPGEILVTRCTDPCWLPAFGVAAGLVTEIGGWLSHAAILAREHDLPTVVGVADATARLRDGDLVRLRRDGGIEPVAEQRRRGRRSQDRVAILRRANTSTPVRVRDLSELGACIESGSGLPAVGSEHELELEGQCLQVAVAWVNCTRAGLRFTTPMAPARNLSLSRTG